MCQLFLIVFSFGLLGLRGILRFWGVDKDFGVGIWGNRQKQEQRQGKNAEDAEVYAKVAEENKQRQTAGVPSASVGMTTVVEEKRAPPLHWGMTNQSPRSDKRRGESGQGATNSLTSENAACITVASIKR